MARERTRLARRLHSTYLFMFLPEIRYPLRVDSVVLKPLAYRDGGRLVVIWKSVKVFGHREDWTESPARSSVGTARDAFSGLAMAGQGTAGIATANEHPRVIGTLRGTQSC
jgi:hypothetical protein